MRQLELWDNLNAREAEVRRAERTGAMTQYARLTHALASFEDCMDVWDTSHIADRWPKEMERFNDSSRALLDKMRGEIAKIRKGLVE